MIQSISDIITNSSSEVFIMSQDKADRYADIDSDGCISIFEIDYDWVHDHGADEWKAICYLCDFDIKALEEDLFESGDIYRFYPDDETWEAFVEANEVIIREKINGLCWVDIEDHFKNAYEVTEEARGDSLWSDYRH